jgi:hypothetical protein
LVEQRTENPRVPSSILGLGTSCIDVRKWLSGRASPCQGEGREFESRLPLHSSPPRFATFSAFTLHPSQGSNLVFRSTLPQTCVYRHSLLRPTLLCSKIRQPGGVAGRSGGIGRRDSLKNCWGATPVSVRTRPSAPTTMPSGVVVAPGTLDPLAQVRILARQPLFISLHPTPYPHPLDKSLCPY